MQKMTEPPSILVKTWYELLQHAEEKEARDHAQDMLIGAFGSQQAVLDYLRANGLIK